MTIQWRISGGGLRPWRAHPPLDQSFFNFIGFSENITKILGRRPLGTGPPRLGEVLDPPLLFTTARFTMKKKFSFVVFVNKLVHRNTPRMGGQQCKSTRSGSLRDVEM